MEEMNTSTEVTEVQQPQEVDNGAANTEEVAQPQEPQQQDLTQTQAFSKRLNEERAKIEEQYNPYKSFVEQEAQRYGMSADEYFKAIEEQQKQAERQEYLDKGIDPDLISKLVSETPEVKWAREQREKSEKEAKFQSEVSELFAMFPDVDPKAIPKEVWAKHDSGVPLKYAYMEYQYSNVAKEAEQKAIEKIQKSTSATPGSLSGESPDHNTSISKMGKTDFEKMIQRVKAGEVSSI